MSGNGPLPRASFGRASQSLFGYHSTMVPGGRLPCMVVCHILAIVRCLLWPSMVWTTVLAVPTFHAQAIIDVADQMQLGNPSGATANTNNHAHYLIMRTVEALDFSDTLGEPVWASWDLTASDVGTNARSKKSFSHPL